MVLTVMINRASCSPSVGGEVLKCYDRWSRMFPSFGGVKLLANR